jgi:hypothetical protein
MARLLWAANSGTGFECCCFIPFSIIWLIVMGTHLNFRWYAAPTALQQWSKEKGYRIVRQQERTFRKGPFLLSSGSSQIVFRIEVLGRDGLMKGGWVRIGGFFWPTVEKIDVHWDQPKPARPDEGPDASHGNPQMWDRELDG